MGQIAFPPWGCGSSTGRREARVGRCPARHRRLEPGNIRRSRRPPYDPVIAARRPPRSFQQPLARVVTFSYQLETMLPNQAAAALGAVLEWELGVPPR